MTTISIKATHKKAHGEVGLDCVEYIAEFNQATVEQRKQYDVMKRLDDLQSKLGLATNHTDNVRHMHDNISIKGGREKGQKYPNTAGTLGLVMVNEKTEPVNFASYSENDETIISDTTQASAFAIGSMKPNGQWWLVSSLAEGVLLYECLAIGDLDVTVLVCLNSSLFDKALRLFAKVNTIHITECLSAKDRIVSRLAGVNAIAHITPLIPMIDMLKDGELINEILADAESIELEALEWGEPEPLANDPSVSTPYPINAFTGLLRQVIEAVAYYAQVPLAMAGQCVLGALAHMGQRFIDAPMGHGHKPASLILITEGESGSGKTQAMGLTHFKIEQHERQQYERYLQDLDVWEADKAALKGAELKEYLSNTPKPTNPKTVFDDATIEPILDKFVDGEIINASWSTDEAGQFFNGHTMKGDTAGNALGAITKLYSNGRASRQRSQKSAHATPRTDAYDVRMTLLLQGQRVILEPALTDPLMNGQGFLARALIACPEDLRGKRVWNDEQRNNDSPYDNPHLIEYWTRCNALLDPLPASQPNESTGAPQRIKMQWENDHTKQVFNNLTQDIENRQANGQTLEYLKAYASRMAENASRIASLMAFFDGRKVITTNDITRAFMLVEYSTAERLRYLDATPTGEQNDSEKLSNWLVDKAKGKKPHKLGRTYISNNARNPMRKNAKLLQSELDKLESAKHIRQEMEGRSKVVLINPKLYD